MGDPSASVRAVNMQPVMGIDETEGPRPFRLAAGESRWELALGPFAGWPPGLPGTRGRQCANTGLCATGQSTVGTGVSANVWARQGGANCIGVCRACVSEGSAEHSGVVTANGTEVLSVTVTPSPSFLVPGNVRLHMLG